MELRQQPDGRWVEVMPTECPNGHPWGPGQFTVLWSGARGWACNTCGAEVWDEPPTDFGRYPQRPKLD